MKSDVFQIDLNLAVEIPAGLYMLTNQSSQIEVGLPSGKSAW